MAEKSKNGYPTASFSTWHLFLPVTGWPVQLYGTKDGLTRIQFGASLENNSSGPVPPWVNDAEGQLREYFSGKRKSFHLPIARAPGSSFEEKVWRACAEIPHGQTMTYGQLAECIGHPGAARATGGALGRNPLPLLTPCHRVIGATGRLTGFSSGLKWKKKLLRLENSAPPPGIAIQW
jgi:O-6-methylguanine DNA methyltransferase